jgi:hypothetical protein
MRNTMFLTSFLLLALTACAQSKSTEDQTKADQSDVIHPLSKKCEDAKRQLDKTVEGGQQTDLRELKRNIELYCIWRRD